MKPLEARARKLALGRAREARYVARLRDRARALFGGGLCHECGSGHDLEFAHVARTRVRGRGRGTVARLLDVLRHPECYRLLCRPCHMDLDYAGRDPWRPAPELELEEVPF